MTSTSQPFPFAQRTNWPLESNALSLELQRLRDQKVQVLDLTESNPTRCGFAYPKESILRPLSGDANLNYTPSPRGNLAAREAVCRDYLAKGYKVSPEQVFLTASTSEAYSYVMRLLLDPGQEALFPAPSYPLFAFLGDLNDVCLETYPLRSDQNWGIDLESLSEKTGPNTRAVILVNPNNPTGTFITPGERKKINAVCRDKAMAIICDEVFFDYTFDASQRFASFVDNTDALTFVLGGVSKALGLPQMKLSWIVMNGPQELVAQAAARLEVIADTYLSVNTPVQNAFVEWVKHKDEVQGTIAARVRANYQSLKERVQGSRTCRLIEGQGGWYAVLRVPDTLSDEEWALKFLTEDHVFVHPGYFFDFDFESGIVVCLLPKEDVFREGIARVLARLG